MRHLMRTASLAALAIAVSLAPLFATPAHARIIDAKASWHYNRTAYYSVKDSLQTTVNIAATAQRTDTTAWIDVRDAAFNDPRGVIGTAATSSDSIFGLRFNLSNNDPEGNGTYTITGADSEIVTIQYSLDGVIPVGTLVANDRLDFSSSAVKPITLNTVKFPTSGLHGTAAAGRFPGIVAVRAIVKHDANQGSATTLFAPQWFGKFQYMVDDDRALQIPMAVPVGH